MNESRDTIGSSCHKYHFCHDKKQTNKQKTRVCHDKTSFVATKVCRSIQKLCLSRQNVCRDKHVFVATKVLDKHTFVNMCLSRQNVKTTSILFTRQKTCFVTINTYLSREKYAQVYKNDVCATNICREKHVFVATKVLDKHSFVSTKGVFCREKDTCGNSRQ